MTARLNLVTGVVTGPSGRVTLSPQQLRILLAVICHRSLASLELAELVWPDADLMPDFWNDSLGTQRCLLNVKLARAGTGWRVVSRQQRSLLIDRPMADGYGFPAPGRADIRKLARRHMATAA